MFYLSFKKFVKPSKLKETGTLPKEVGSLYCVNLIKHCIVIDGYFFVDETEEVIRYIGLAKRVIVDDRVLLAYIVPVC